MTHSLGHCHARTRVHQCASWLVDLSRGRVFPSLMPGCCTLAVHACYHGSCGAKLVILGQHLQRWKVPAEKMVYIRPTSPRLSQVSHPS
ncbi:hypothetical protein V8C86DRAFT_1818188, partial [Haematococcus lacustris]